MAFVEYDNTAKKESIRLISTRKYDADLQVYGGQGREEIDVDHAMCHWVPELCREGLLEVRKETIDLNECRTCLHQIVARHPGDTSGIGLGVGGTHVPPGPIPAVKDLDLGEQHCCLHVQDERVELVVQMVIDDVRLIRPLSLVWGY